jgi:hypothetical protein
MPSSRLQINRSCTQSAHSSKPGIVGHQTSKAAPKPANNTLATEIWFGVADERASAAATRCAQALPRAAIGRRFESSSDTALPSRGHSSAYNGRRRLYGTQKQESDTRTTELSLPAMASRSWFVHEFQLQPVRVGEEHRVITRRVVILGRHIEHADVLALQELVECIDTFA